MLQVLEEEELAAMRAHQEHFEHIRNAELVATQKMEQAERRKVEEKERRLKQAKERAEKERTVREKVAASMFARGFLTGMVDSVIASLWTKGHFQDPVEVTVKNKFMPWLEEAMHNEFQNRNDALAFVSSVVTDAAAMMDQLQDAHSIQRGKQMEAEDTSKVCLGDRSPRRRSGMCFTGIRRQVTCSIWGLVQARRDSEAAALKSSVEEEMESRSARLLTTVVPHVISQAKIDAARQDLESKSDEAANTEWDALKEQAGTTAREKAEQQAEAAAESAAEAAAVDGDAPEDGANEPAAPAIDVEALVAEAVEVVAKPEVKPVTDTDVLNALMDADAGLKDSIVSFMALQQLEGSWIHDDRFADELDPKDE